MGATFIFRYMRLYRVEALVIREGKECKSFYIFRAVSTTQAKAIITRRLRSIPPEVVQGFTIVGVERIASYKDEH